MLSHFITSFKFVSIFHSKLSYNFYLDNFVVSCWMSFKLIVLNTTVVKKKDIQ